MAFIIGRSGYTKAQFLQSLAGKQDTLDSGVNIKTINGNNILGAGNVDINPRHYEYDLTDTEIALKTDTISKINTYNPNGSYVMIGFITDIHTMPTKSEISEDTGVESVVEAILASGIELEPAAEGETIAGEIRSTWPSSDVNYYGKTSERSIVLLGAICHDAGVDAVLCNGDLSSGRLPYNSYAYMLEIIARTFDQYISVPYFIADGNHDRKYDSNVQARINSEWRKYMARFVHPKNLGLIYVKDIQEAVVQGDANPLLGYSVDINKNQANKLRLAVLSNYEKSNGGVYATSLNYSMSMTNHNANEWVLCCISHTNFHFSTSYYDAAFNGTAKSKGASSDQHTFPAMNNGVKYKGVLGGIHGHLHQSACSEDSGYHLIRVINSYGEKNSSSSDNYGFSIFIFDTDNWWLYEIQVGRHSRNDADYPDVEGLYEKIATGVYRYKIKHNE